MSMTATELTNYINKEGTWSTPIANIKVRVKILDARKAYGRFELRVTPLAGSGETWAQNVEVDKPIVRGIVKPSIGTSGAPGGLP